MRVLMFGWEFPPFLSGGLGVASEGLVRGLLLAGTEIVLVLPRHPFGSSQRHLRIVDARVSADPDSSVVNERPPLRLRRVPSLLRPYVTPVVYAKDREVAQGSRPRHGQPYGPSLEAEVLRLAEVAGRIARRERFDVIHAHEWLTFLAGIEARRVSGKPLVLHVHATELDRAGDGGNRLISEIERFGLTQADRVIAVSRYTAELVSRAYGVPPERIRVVHNAIDPKESVGQWEVEADDPLVLFAGRITWQKGPTDFVQAAARVADEIPNVKFAVAGAGDQMIPMIKHVARLGLDRKFLFTGFLSGPELNRLYARANVYVMPSVSEPFGLTALEALQQGTPVILSRSAGVSEVVHNVLRVEPGDIEGLASKILSVLLFPPLSRALASAGQADVRRLSWSESAQRCLAVYREVVVSERGA